MERQDSYFDKVGREAGILCGGIGQGALDEAWKRAQNPASLYGTIAKDVMVGAGVAAVCTAAPEIVFPLMVCGTGAMLLEDRAEQKKTWAKTERIFNACKAAWDDSTKEATAKNVVAVEWGKQAFDGILGGIAAAPGMAIGMRFAEGKMAQIAEEAVAKKSMATSSVLSDVVRTKIPTSHLSTFERTVIKQLESGLPNKSGQLLVTERAPDGTLSFSMSMK